MALAEAEVPRAATRGTVKGLGWKIVYGNHRAALAPDGWEALARATGAPRDVKALDLGADLPVAPFNEALAWLSRETGVAVREMGVEAARRWGTMYRTLLGHLEGRPDLLLALFTREVHPWLVNGPPGTVTSGGQRTAVVELHDELDREFRAGLLTGLLGLAGVTGTVEGMGASRYRVEWDEPRALAPRPWRVWLAACRLHLLPWTLAPLAAGSALAWAGGDAAWPAFALAVAAAVTLHLSANLWNDVIDHRRGVDPANLTPTPFSGGSRVIQRGLVSWTRMAVVAGVLGAAGIALGLALVAAFSPSVLLLGLVGVALGFSYSGPPLRLAYRGLGEAAVLLAFGPLTVAGAYAVHAGVPTAAAFAAGLPLGILAATMLLAGELPDAPWDAKQGKRTLAVVLGPRAPYAVPVGIALAALSLGALVLVSVLPLATLAAVLALAPGVAASRRVLRASPDRPDAARAQVLLLLTHALFGALVAGALAWEAYA